MSDHLLYESRQKTELEAERYVVSARSSVRKGRVLWETHALDLGEARRWTGSLLPLRPHAVATLVPGRVVCVSDCEPLSPWTTPSFYTHAIREPSLEEMMTSSTDTISALLDWCADNGISIDRRLAVVEDVEHGGIRVCHNSGSYLDSHTTCEFALS